MSANIRRQFQRVQQRLDQSIGRAEKSKVLNDEQQELDKRVEQLKTVCLNLSKKLQNCLTSQGQQIDSEKILKKLPWYCLSQSLIESSEQLGRNTCIGQMFQLCGDAEGNIAKVSLDMENNIETDVLRPIVDLLEVDIPSIQKLKKQLSNRALDMDAAKARHAAAIKQLQQGTGLQSKVEAAREEVEDANSKMEQTRDQLATEMYAFVTKESDLSRYLLDLVKAEVSYHQQSVQILSALIPQLEEGIEFSILKPVFGLPLEKHLENGNRKIATVLEDCITALKEYGLEEEGLFRIAGSSLKVKKLKAALNSSSGSVILCPEDFDPHVIATVLKQYLRELPEPLMTFELYNEWVHTIHLPVDQRVAALHPVLCKLPKLNMENLRYLVKFLAKVADYSDVNKMTPSNLALVMAPNLLWPLGDTGMNVMATGIQSAVVELLISHADLYFPDDCLRFSHVPDGEDWFGNIATVSLKDAVEVTAGEVEPSTANHGPLTLQYDVHPPSVGGVRSGDTDADTSADTGQTHEVGLVVPVQPEELRTDAISRTPSVMKRASKKAPAPKPPMETKPQAGNLNNSSGPAIDDVMASPPTMPNGATNDLSSCPESPECVSPRISRPKERPPERPPLPPSRASVIPTFPVDSDPSDLVRARSPSLTGVPSDERSIRVYPALIELEASTPSASEVRHTRTVSDTGLPSRSPRPTPPPPPPPISRRDSEKQIGTL